MRKKETESVKRETKPSQPCSRVRGGVTHAVCVCVRVCVCVCACVCVWGAQADLGVLSVTQQTVRIGLEVLRDCQRLAAKGVENYI